MTSTSTVDCTSAAEDAPQATSYLTFAMEEFLFGHIMRRSMMCFETAVNPFVKYHLEKEFPDRCVSSFKTHHLDHISFMLRSFR